MPSFESPLSFPIFPTFLSSRMMMTATRRKPNSAMIKVGRKEKMKEE
jgi:hypothetical protein